MPDDRTRNDVAEDDADGRMDSRLRLAGERWRAADGDGEVVATVDDHDVEVSRDRSVRVTKRRRFATIAAAAAVVAALGVTAPLVFGGGDGSSPAGSAAPLRGTVWRLVAVGDADPDAGSTATLSISTSGALTADDECTLIGGSVSNTETSVDVTKTIVRYKSCTDQYGVRLSNAAAVLTGNQPYSISSDTLAIGSGQDALHFTAMPDNFPAPTLDTPTFVGATWDLASAKNADGTMVALGGDSQLTVSDASQFRSTGCNFLAGTVLGVGPQVTFRLSFTTQILCRGAAGSSDGLVHAVLSGKVTQSVLGNRLTITKPGTGTLVYRWVPADPSATSAAALFGKDWRLVSAGGVPVSEQLRLYMGGSGGSWTVAADDHSCAVGGTVRASEGSISFTSDGAGDGLCKESLGKTLADEVTSGFADARLFGIQGDSLTLYGDGAQAAGLLFVKDSAPTTRTPSGAPTSATTSSLPPILGTTWLLTSSIDLRGRGPGPLEQPVTVGRRLIIRQDGTYAAHGLCQSESGRAEIHGSQIIFEQTGQNVCAPRPGTQTIEDETLAAMVRGSVTWSITDDRLHLTKGSTTLVFDAS